MDNCTLTGSEFSLIHNTKNQNYAMASSLELRGGDDFSESPLQLELVLAYEDKFTAERAKHAVESVLSKPELNACPQLNLWRLDALNDPEMKKQAEQQASAADILVVSLHGRNRLAAHAENRLKEWVGRKRTKPRALVISLDFEAQSLVETNPTVAVLRSTAVRSGFTVLLHFGEPTRSKLDAAVADLHSREPSTLHIPDESQQRPDSYRGWGINE